MGCQWQPRPGEDHTYGRPSEADAGRRLPAAGVLRFRQALRGGATCTPSCRDGESRAYDEAMAT